MNLTLGVDTEELLVRPRAGQEEGSRLGNREIHLAVRVEIARRGLQGTHGSQPASELTGAKALDAQPGLGRGDVEIEGGQPVGRAVEDDHAGRALHLEITAQGEVVVAVAVQVAECEGTTELARLCVEDVFEDQVGAGREGQGAGTGAADEQVGVGSRRVRVGQQEIIESVAVVVADHLRARGQRPGGPGDGGDVAAGDRERRNGRLGGDRRAGNDIHGRVVRHDHVILAVAVPVQRMDAGSVQVG